MDEQDQHQPRQRVGGGGEGVFVTLISAAIFLYVGFVMSFSPADSAPAAYRLATYAFTWMAKLVGVGLLVVAVIEFAGVQVARILDCGLAAIAAVICLITGGIWVFYGDNDGFWLLLFGLINGSAARSAVSRAR